MHAHQNTRICSGRANGIPFCRFSARHSLLHTAMRSFTCLVAPHSPIPDPDISFPSYLYSLHSPSGVQGCSRHGMHGVIAARAPTRSCCVDYIEGIPASSRRHSCAPPLSPLPPFTPRMLFLSHLYFLTTRPSEPRDARRKGRKRSRK